MPRPLCGTMIKYPFRREEDKAKTHSQIRVWIDLLFGVYAGVVILLGAIGGGVRGAMNGFLYAPGDIAYELFFDMLGLPYSRALEIVLTLTTLALVVLYLVRFLLYVKEYRSVRRFEEQTNVILLALESLIEQCKTEGDLQTADRLQKAWKENIEKLGYSTGEVCWSKIEGHKN